ncbi:MAG: SDR family oxidoreductase [Thermodesulfobacteriota bacterium]
MKTISILGCGWLGLPLAEKLIQLGHSVKGSTRSSTDLPRLGQKGIIPFSINLDPTIIAENADSFFDTEILIINFPPQRREDIVKYHEMQAISLIESIKKSAIEKVIFVSSTSVYPDLNREVSEDDTHGPTKESGKALIKFESLLKECSEFKTTILRFAGLIGYNRNPGRFLAGKKEVVNADAPVNLIHRDDCVNIIVEIIDKDLWGETLNACSDVHPLRKDYYISAANKLGLAPPEFKNTEHLSFKIINSDKLKKLLNYQFIHPDPTKIDFN